MFLEPSQRTLRVFSKCIDMDDTNTYLKLCMVFEIQKLLRLSNMIDNCFKLLKRDRTLKNITRNFWLHASWILTLQWRGLSIRSFRLIISYAKQSFKRYKGRFQKMSSFCGHGNNSINETNFEALNNLLSQILCELSLTCRKKHNLL